ncbi:hypothetical protein ATL39_1336 [Sinobaca qinghaiensis]|uniref:Uncharacterized protein n=1 Tax=Sinobaca qinghaiensis TaxID=342944 RepID=A0A419V6M1_9BACL|nr:YtxH domain-containing protein [Sinobaca qinghaiensis]RKD75635.1 hypothetical protein ATL39_1336 [Sinobaca qinghaiensis]
MTSAGVKENRSDEPDFATGLTVGFLLSFALTLLTAPVQGKEFRAQTAEKAQQKKTSLQETKTEKLEELQKKKASFQEAKTEKLEAFQQKKEQKKLDAEKKKAAKQAEKQAKRDKFYQSGQIRYELIRGEMNGLKEEAEKVANRDAKNKNFAEHI